MLLAVARQTTVVAAGRAPAALPCKTSVSASNCRIGCGRSPLTCLAIHHLNLVNPSGILLGSSPANRLSCRVPDRALGEHGLDAAVQLLDGVKAGTVDSPEALPQAQAQAVQPKKRRGRVPKPRASDADLVQALVTRTQLPQAIAQRLLDARAGTPGVSSDADKLCQNVLALQELLGPEHAKLALRRFPSIVAYSPQRLALNYRQWQLFFGAHDTSRATTAVTRQLQEARQQGLLRKLCNNPQLLCADVEKQVGNLYEIGVLIQAEDLHAFAYHALDMALSGPHVVQEKLIRVLTILNSEILSQQQQQPSSQPQVQAVAGAGTATSPAGHKGQAHTDAGGAATATAAAAGPSTSVFSLADLQAAARRDQKWLSLTADTLEQRLLGLQQEFGVPMCQVGAMFLRNPSLLLKKPSTVAAKLTALQALPGLDPHKAWAAAAAMPSLLNLTPDKVANRWRLLQQAADTHAAWRAQLDGLLPSTLASLLIRSEERYQRLPRVIALRAQAHVSLSTAFNASNSSFAQKLEKRAQQHEPAKPRQ